MGNLLELPFKFVGLSWLPIEFPGKIAYPNHADEFVRLIYRCVRTGWRRDEWAYSPLFIWGKTMGRAHGSLGI